MTTSDCLYVNMSESATVVKNIVGDVRGSEGSSREYKGEKSKALRDGGHCNERGRRLLLVRLKGSTGDFIVAVPAIKNKDCGQEKTADNQGKNDEEEASQTPR